jgi:hypothetical protein
MKHTAKTVKEDLRKRVRNMIHYYPKSRGGSRHRLLIAQMQDKEFIAATVALRNAKEVVLELSKKYTAENKRLRAALGIE